MPIVTVQWWKGNKSREIKQEVASQINKAVVDAVIEAHDEERLGPEGVWIIFDEIERENWMYGAELGNHRTAAEVVAAGEDP